MNNRPPTLSDVAEACGVSRAQVGRVLGDYGYVGEETRKRVIQAAERLGYVPNGPARNVRRQEATTLGVIVGDIENSYFSQVVRGISNVAHQNGFNLVLTNSDEQTSEERVATRALRESRVAGVLVAPTPSDDVSHLIDLQRVGIPVVIFDRPTLTSLFDLVLTTNFTGGREAAQHLLAAGHREFGVISASAVARPLLESRTTSEANAIDRAMDPDTARVAGILSALEEVGVTPREEWIRTRVQGHVGARKAARQILSGRDRPTAVVMTNITMSLGVLEALRELPVRVPRDLSLVGFDDHEWTKVLDAPLTVMAQPTNQIGVAAAQMLISRIRGASNPPETLSIAMTLMDRASVAPPPPTT